MPGIVGLITTLPREVAESQLRKMVAAMCHSPDYERGTWVDAELGVYIGWTALKHHPARMPLADENGDIVLVFSGEDFSGDMAEQPRPASHLLEICRRDKNFPASLNGRFHGVMVDRALGTALLFNDRYGLHRVYYCESRDGFYFAAEAKALLAVMPKLRHIDPQGLGEFLSCGCVLQNRSLFAGVRVLPSASAWSIRRASVIRKVYFEESEWEEQTPLAPEPYYEELRAAFSQSLPRYFRGPQPVGISLTGGLDTRMIMAWLPKSLGPLRCYSFGGKYRDCQDVLIARRVAEACGHPHNVIRVGSEFLARFGAYAQRTVYLTDGCVEVRHSPDLYVNEIAAQIAPVRMTGNYGGEVLRCVRAFKPVDTVAGLFDDAVLPHLDKARRVYAGLLQVHPLSFAVFRQAPWHHYGLLSLEQTQVSLRSPYLDNCFVRTVFRAPVEALANNDLSLRLIRDGNRALLGIRTDRGLAGAWGSVLSEARRRFLEFTFKAEYAYDYGMPQVVARIDHVLSGLHLERAFLGRHKFYHFRIWYRDELAPYIRGVLLDPRSLARPYLRRSAVEHLVREHTTGTRNYTVAIHKLLTLELIQRTLLESQ